MMLRTGAASRSGCRARRKHEVRQRGARAKWGLPFNVTIKPVCGVRVAVNTCKRKPHTGRPAFRMGATVGSRGKGGATFATLTAWAPLMSPAPVAFRRGNRNLSVPARRVTGSPESVATAGAGLSGLEVMRVCVGKAQRRIMAAIMRGRFLPARNVEPVPPGRRLLPRCAFDAGNRVGFTVAVRFTVKAWRHSSALPHGSPEGHGGGAASASSRPFDSPKSGARTSKSERRRPIRFACTFNAFPAAYRFSVGIGAGRARVAKHGP